jgi:uroporphyrinogen decarboxylase
MDSKELVYRALNFEKVPRVPYAIAFTVPALQKLRSSKLGRSLHDAMADDLLLIPSIRVEWGVRDEQGSYTDEFGLLWDRRIDPDIGMPRPMVTPENIDRIPWPDPYVPGRFDLLEGSMKEHPDRFQMMSVDFSLYERAWGLRGLENMYLDMVERPEFTEALLDKILDFNMKIVETALQKFPGLDGVHFGDDYGDQNGVTMGPERWRRMIKPRLARQYGLVKTAGKKVSVHCCGSVEAILDDLVEIGGVEEQSGQRLGHGHIQSDAPVDGRAEKIKIRANDGVEADLFLTSIGSTAKGEQAAGEVSAAF